ncbi:hypothetical protein [Rhodanobacter sp. MP1X3]|uniref:hypothetical protein n=1 Tax=Rhodanobacter sp. MP1X3 TaxID=2723086 RepID=UPI0017C498CB|nr:hypothetical protein [Rhodanobacter sp. MP1X3]MBB6242913.1 hypothetical protein [Rhodanobacter sp. MP1X3]
MSSSADRLPPLTIGPHELDALRDLGNFSLTDALFNRRSRRFFRGAEIPDGPLQYRSKHAPLPLSDLERLLVLLAMGGVTGWSNLITRHDRYAPHLSNYSGSASGRTGISAAGFQTSEIFFTDDSGTYIFETRDFAPPVARGADGKNDLEALLNAHQSRIRRISNERIHLPRREPYMEGHNTWVANAPGSLLAFPVGDLAQHTLLNLIFYVQNGFCIYDDINGRPIPGIEEFADLVDIKQPYPLSFVDQYSLAELSAELAVSSYNGQLLLQAMGLGGWSFDGIDRLSILGASGDPQVPGLGFRFDTDPRWALPNPTGLEGVFTTLTPPHYPDMHAALDALIERKYGTGGPFHPDTPGPWSDSPGVRASAQVHDARFRACVALQAQYAYDTFGKFPATIPSTYILMYLQAHHLDLDFYDRKFTPGAYLATHAEHLQRWHAGHTDISA